MIGVGDAIGGAFQLFALAVTLCFLASNYWMIVLNPFRFRSMGLRFLSSLAAALLITTIVFQLTRIDPYWGIRAMIAIGTVGSLAALLHLFRRAA